MRRPIVVETLLRWSRRNATMPRRFVALLVGGFFFLGLVPALLTWCGVWLRVPSASVPPLASAVIVTLTFSLGVFWLGWATLSQWRYGQGTPAPIAPTQRLVVRGPYRLCRNPIELGAVLYYLSFGTLFATLGIGLFVAGVALVLGSAYHRLIEERELVARFGDEYLRYRESTPFLVPSLRQLIEQIARDS